MSGAIALRNYARMDVDVQEYVEDIGVVGSNIDVLAQELDRLQAGHPEESVKVKEMKTELDCACDYTENAQKIYADLEEEREKYKGNKAIKDGCTKILETHPGDTVKSVQDLVKFCKHFSSVAKRRNLHSAELEELDEKIKIFENVLKFLQDVAKRTPQKKRGGQKARGNCCC